MAWLVWLADPGLRLAGAFAAVMAGSALQMQQAALWSATVYAALAGCGLLAACIGAWRPRAGNAAPWRTLALTAGLALLAFGSTGWRADERLADRLAPALEGRDLLVTGTIAELPRASLTGTRFVLRVEQATDQGMPVQVQVQVQVPERVWLGWSRGPDGDALLVGPGPELRAGQRWRFVVRLQAPHGTLNPHGFDAELWLFERGIGATGSVRATAATPAELLDERAAHPIERLRQRVRDAIVLRVPDAGAAGVLAALAVGDQAAIERTDWALFRVTGVAHLVAISGLHVTMFAWLAGAVIGRLWRLSGRLLLHLPAPHAARWGGLAAAAGYALLAGWGVPAQRTVWMIAAVVVLRSSGLRWPPLLVLGAAGALISALDPWALLQAGFWLSFAAVGLLMVAAPDDVVVHEAPAPGAAAGWRGRAQGWWRSAWRTQVVASIGLAPLTLLFFQQVSLVGFLANLLAIPWVTLVVTPLALLGVVAPPLWLLGGWAVQAMIAVLELLGGVPWAVWTAAAAPAWAAAAGLLGGALLVAPLPRRLRALGLPLLLPLLWPATPRPPEGAFEMVAADVGQGSAVLVRTRQHLLLYDAGPGWSESDAGERVLLPLLLARGERRIDTLLLSHRDTDHVGGAASLMRHVPTGELLGSLEDGHPLRAMGVPWRRCDAGAGWTWDGVRFELLHPTPDEHARGGRPNTLSCVLRVVDARGRALLLTGDIEAAQEAALLERRRAQLPAELLLVPHHGSRTSSGEAFIAAVGPQTAVVQAGWRNRFGHPNAAVVARYAAQGVTLQRTDRCGAFTREADGSSHCTRQRDRRYWHHRP